MDTLIPNLMTLAMLTLLQAVLGFDNLLYISIESKRVPPDRQSFVRKAGIGIAIVLRIVLLFAVLSAIDSFKEPFFTLAWKGVIECKVNVHSFIVFLGGGFVIYTAIKEIYHMLAADELDHDDGDQQRSVGTAMFWIVSMNLVFSFDSILSAIALTKVFWVMATAIVISGTLMVLVADRVAEFLKKNRMYEVLGLFILFIVGIMLVSQGGHLSHLHLFGYAVEEMSSTTFYFVLVVLIVVDIVQGRYQAKLLARRNARAAAK